MKISQALLSTSGLVAGNNNLFVTACPLLADVSKGGITGSGGLGTSG